MHVAVRRNLRRQRGQAHEMSALRDDALAGLHAFEHLNDVGLPNAERHWPSLERLTTRMHEHDWASRIIDHGRYRDDRCGRGFLEQQPKKDGLPERQHQRAIIEREDDLQCAGLRVEHFTERRRSTGYRHGRPARDFELGCRRPQRPRRLCFRNPAGHVDLRYIGHFEQGGPGGDIRSGRCLARRDCARNRRAKDKESCCAASAFATARSFLSV